MKIVLTGGGTGGHIIPLIAVARKIKEKIPEAQFLFIGPDGDLEKNLFGKEGIPTKSILTGKMRRYFSFQNFVDFFKVPIGIIQSLGILLVNMPDAIFSKGGYASLPVVLAAWLYRIPVMVHESDSVPGMANVILGKFCTRVAVSYPETESNFSSAQVVMTGNPLRADIDKGSAESAREKYGLTESKKLIFVYGGSQGSQIINSKILNILPTLLQKYQIIQQTGEKNLKEIEAKAGELGIKAGREGYHPLAFIGEEIKDILAAADLVISRAGANSISEFAACGKACILIPLEGSANNHQRMNAYSLAKIGACVVLEENNLGENFLMAKIEEILETPELKKKLEENIKVFYHPNATEMIADGIIGMIKK